MAKENREERKKPSGREGEVEKVGFCSAAFEFIGRTIADEIKNSSAIVGL